MHFGIIRKVYFLTNIVAVSLFLSSCGEKKTQESNRNFNLLPESGTLVQSGDDIALKVDMKGEFADSVQYFLDDQFIGSEKDTSTLRFNSTGILLGSRFIQAKIYYQSDTTILNSNLVIVTAKVPDQYGYQVVNTYDHDITAYTQGLEFHDGIFYESDGENGGSSLRRVSLEGKVLKQIDFPYEIFAEGIAIVDNKIIMLTWQQKMGFIFDKNTLEQIGTFPYQNSLEGWGLCFDGNKLYKSDGSNKIYILNKDNYREERYIEVCDNKGPVTQLNELEWIDGKIYANIYTSDLIAIINPNTGEVESYINLIGLRKDDVEDESQHVLNGIAWDAKGKRLFVTGKTWPKLYEIKLVKR